MSTESLPTFSLPARKLWGAIPADIRQRLLTNVWCGECRGEVTITDFCGRIEGGDLVLVGRCNQCRSSVARLIERPLPRR